ncbi:MAG: hypothetical protein VZR53_08065 [Prevotella sp.]|nr:hypothetical protein [Prevotella sp.]
MLTVSSAMQEYINSPVRGGNQYVRVEVVVDELLDTRISFDLADMKNGSVSISRRAVGSNIFDIGQSYIDGAKFTVDKEVLEDKYSLDLIGKRIQVIYGVSEINEGEDEEVVIFTGRIPQGGIVKTAMLEEISVDSMLADLTVDVQELTSATPLAFFEHIANQTGVSLSTRLVNYVTAHTNNQYTFYIAEDSTVNTYLDLAMWLSQILGCAITCNNLGELDVVVYDHTQTPFELHQDICKSSEVSESTIYFNACTITVDNVEQKIIGSASDTNVLRLTDNPLLTAFQDETLRNIIITNIFTQIQDEPIRGFSYSYNGNPLIELGDYIRYKGVNTFVQCIEYGFRKVSKLEGYTIDNRIGTTSQSIRSAAHSGGGGGTPSSETVGVLKWTNAERYFVRYNKKTIVAEEYIALYANSRALLTTTMVFSMYSLPEGVDSLTLVIHQYFDNVELPMRILQTVRKDDTFVTVSFNAVVPESDIYETHQYRLEAEFWQDSSGTITTGTYIGWLDPYNVETDIIGFMAAGGQPTFVGTYFCEDRVALNTSVEDVDVNTVGEIADTVNVSIN